jgi:lysosomal acid lipase/cholesteryl ester hydrolase
LGHGEFLPQSKIIQWLAKYGCERVTAEQKICEDSMFVIAGFDEEQFNVVGSVRFSYKVSVRKPEGKR